MLNYETSTPSTMDEPKRIFEEIRGYKARFKERFELDHCMNGELNTALAGADGQHNQVTLYPQISDPEIMVNAIKMFCKTISNAVHLFLKTQNETFQITETSDLNSITLTSSRFNREYVSTLPDCTSENIITFVAKDGEFGAATKVVDQNYSRITVPDGSFVCPGVVSKAGYHNGYYYIYISGSIYKSANLSSWTFVTNANGFSIVNDIIFFELQNSIIYSVDGTTFSNLDLPDFPVVTPMFYRYSGDYRVVYKASDNYLYIQKYLRMENVLMRETKVTLYSVPGTAYFKFITFCNDIAYAILRDGVDKIIRLTGNGWNQPYTCPGSDDVINGIAMKNCNGTYYAYATCCIISGPYCNILLEAIGYDPFFVKEAVESKNTGRNYGMNIGKQFFFIRKDYALTPDIYKFGFKRV